MCHNHLPATVAHITLASSLISVSTATDEYDFLLFIIIYVSEQGLKVRRAHLTFSKWSPTSALFAVVLPSDYPVDGVGPEI